MATETSQYGTQSPISVSDLQNPSSPLQFSSGTAIPPFDVKNIPLPPAPAQLTKTEKSAEDLIGQLTSLTESTRGESAYRASQEAERGIPEMERAQRDLEVRLRGLQNEALAIPLQLQQDATGRGITRAGLAPIETAALRNNAIQALSTASLLEASRGNLASAYDYADRAVKQKFDPIKEDIAVKQANLNLILQSPQFSLEQKNRAEARLAEQQAWEKYVAKQEAQAKEISDTALTALKYGAPADVVKKMQEARTPQEAQQLGFQYLRDPKAKYELEAARLDNVLKNAQIAKLQRETSLLGNDPKDTEDLIKRMREAELAIPTIQQQIEEIDILKDHSGMGARVGPSILGRGAKGIKGRLISGAAGAAAGAAAGLPFSGVGAIPGALIGGALGALKGTPTEITGKGQSFAGSVQKIQKTLTLENLIAAKEKGATFGALSDTEIKLLADAASKLSNWEIVDDKGRGTGYWNIDEKSFQREMDTIRQYYELDLARKGQDALSPTTRDALDAAYSDTASDIDPSIYF